MALYQLKSSFAGGELSAAMFGRVDMNKYDSGAAELKNFLVLRYGGAANRPGFRFIAQTYNNKKAVLIPFIYSADQNYNIEITAGRCQFYTNGSILKNDDGTPYSIENFFTDRDMESPEKIKYTQSADVLFIVHPDHEPMTLTRYGILDWRFERMDVTGGPFDGSLYKGADNVVYRTVRQTYSTAGTYTITLPENTSTAEVEVAGAGGGGGGAWASNYYGRARSGGQGGRGALLKRVFNFDSNNTLTIVVGHGGVAGSNVRSSDSYYGFGKDGGDGGMSSVSNGTVNISAQGGGGGIGGGYYLHYPEHGSKKERDYDNVPGTSYGNGGIGGLGGVGRSQEDSSGKLVSVAADGKDGWVTVTYTVVIDDNIGISASDVIGQVTLTASGDIFSVNDENTLMELNYYKNSEYSKGNPATDSLQISVLPKATVYVESFGFWNGDFALERYNNATQQWVKIRSQSGNRSQNYNFTETNNLDEIVNYRITSTGFDTSVWSGENERQRGYVTLQAFGNDYSGQVLITKFVSSTQVQGVVKKRLATTDATKDFSFSSWSTIKGYPSAVGFYEDRLTFAGSPNNPQTAWASKTGDYYNFGVSIPSVDDDAVTFTLNGGQMNGIKAIIAFGEMILLTAGGEYKVSGGGKPLTGSNVLSQPQEYRGVSDVNPVTVGSRIVYVQHQGNIIRDLAYSYDVDKYTGDDLNLLASHLFDGHKIISMTYQQIPNSIIWCVRDDGLLLGLTYIKEQDVYAWHQHQTSDGKFVSVCSISGRTEDQLYAVIERGGHYYVEMLASRDASTDVADQFYVDSGISYSGEPVTEITGLEHLEGYRVAILADGNVLPEQLVDDGKVVLGNAYSKVQVGLPIDAVLRSLPIEFQGQDGTYLSRKKRIAAINIMLKDSRGGLYGINDKQLDEIKWRSTENYGEPIKLQTGKFKIAVPSSTWSETQQVIIKQPLPLPLTVLAMVPEIEAGG